MLTQIPYIMISCRVAQAVYFFTYVPSPAGQIWMPFPIFIGSIHINALLALLNYRDVINGRGLLEEEDIKAIPALSELARAQRMQGQQHAQNAMKSGFGMGEGANVSPLKHTIEQDVSAHESPAQDTEKDGELGRMRFAVRSFLSMGSTRESPRESTHSDAFGLNLGSFGGSIGSLGRRSRRETPIDLAAANGRGMMETVSEGEEGRVSALHFSWMEIKSEWVV